MIEQVGRFWRSQTVRLTLIYVAIIMSMSLLFSGALFSVSSGYLERQIPERVLNDEMGQFGPAPRVIRYIEQQTTQGKADMLAQLMVFNCLVLVFGGAISFVLARWTLSPIERNMASQTRFVSDASHELRTPLTAIQTSNEVALRRKQLTIEQAKQLITENLEDVKRLQRMITRLFQIISQDSKLIFDLVAAQAVIDRSIADVRSLAQAKSIDIVTEPSSLMVNVDYDAASQALTALIDNAIKYSADNSKVIIKSRHYKRSFVAIDVIDHGVGISKNDLKNIFNRFYRSDEARTRRDTNGFGLGLEIAQKLALAHGGNIEVKSKPGQGSVFSLLLPYQKTQAAK